MPINTCAKIQENNIYKVMFTSPHLSYIICFLSLLFISIIKYKNVLHNQHSKECLKHKNEVEIPFFFLDFFFNIQLKIVTLEKL